MLSTLRGVENLVEKVEKFWGIGDRRVWKNRWKMCKTLGSFFYFMWLCKTKNPMISTLCGKTGARFLPENGPYGRGACSTKFVWNPHGIQSV